MADYTPLGDYIKELCEGQNLSLRQASLQSGLSAETVSKIIRRAKDGPPRPATLEKLAETLGGDYGYMLELAGYLDPAKEEVEDAALRAELLRIGRLWRRLYELDPEGLKRVANAAYVLTETHLAAYPERRVVEEVEEDG